MTSPALAGRRILVTRAAHQAAKLSDGLRALGAVPIEVPVLEIRPPARFGPLDDALASFGQYDWLIFTSTNAVRALNERAKARGISLDSSMKVAAVGGSTAAAAREAGFQVELVPESYVAESLVEEMVGRVRSQRILLARAEVARDVIPDAFRAAGALVDVVDVYRNVMPESAPELLRQAVAEGIVAATFTSTSSVTHLAEAVRAAGLSWPLEAVRAISIGPVTSLKLRESGWEPAGEADRSDIPGLIAAVVSVLRGQGTR